MKKLFIFCFTLIHLVQAQAQNWTWAEHAGGILPDEANGCTMDNNGNMYASGFYFSSSINFGNGNSLSNAGLSDGFIVKYNANGSTQWASRMKGTLEDKATGCAVDNAGNVIVTGYFNSPSLQFGGNNAHSISNFNGSGNSFDCFIVKYNSSGTPLWFHALGKSDDDGGRSVTTDSVGNVYLTGWFRAPSITVGSFTLYNKNPSGGTSDMLLVKYDPDGNVLWAKNAGGSDDEKGNRVTVDNAGNVIVTGYCKADSIEIEGNFYQLSGSKDAFVIKYSPDGTLMAAKVFGGSGGDEPFSCSADASGNIFLTGWYSSNTLAFDAHTLTKPGSGAAIFLAKLDPMLNTIWALTAGSSSKDESRGCSTDKYGNTVITGIFSGSSITFGNTVLNNNGGEEIFVAKYDPDGNLFWAVKAGKSKDDGSNDVYIDDNGRVLIAGYYNSSSIRFGNIDMDNSYIGISTSDYFIANTCNATKVTDTRTACTEYTWIDGNTYNTSNNTATVNIAGSGNSCDSIVTLNLTVLGSATGTDNKTACDPYTWIDGNTYSESNNTATFHIAGGAANSCDSLVKLNLTITAADISISTLDATFTANAANSTYRWLDCDNNFEFMQGETAQTFTATATGNYAVELTQNSCIDTSDCVANSTVGVLGKEAFHKIIIYPNPNNGIVNLDFGSLNRVSVNVINLSGKSVYKKEAIHASTYQFELKKEVAGIYFVEIILENEIQRFKMVLN